MGAAPVAGDVWDMLCSATRYVIQKSSDGLTVGLHLDSQSYGEGHSPAGDLDQAVRAAYAFAVDRRDRQKAPSGNGNGHAPVTKAGAPDA